MNSKHRGTETWNEALDENAFRALYEEHFNYVWFTLRRHGVRARDLEDLTHDVFVACARAWDRYDTDRPLRPWLHGIAFRVASDHRRRGQVANEVPVGEVLATVDGVRERVCVFFFRDCLRF